MYYSSRSSFTNPPYNWNACFLEKWVTGGINCFIKFSQSLFSLLMLKWLKYWGSLSTALALLKPFLMQWTMEAHISAQSLTCSPPELGNHIRHPLLRGVDSPPKFSSAQPPGISYASNTSSSAPFTVCFYKPS